MRLLLNAVIASSFSVSSPSQTEMWTPEVMMQTKQISDIQISPNNERVLFVVTEPNLGGEKGALESKIYIGSVNGKETARPFSAPNVSSTQPRWSPDGKWIAFLSKREGEKNLYLIPVNGGEASLLVKGDHDIQTFSWSPDSQKIAFVRADQTVEEKTREKTSLAYVYQHDPLVNRLFTLDVFASKPEPRAMTPDSYCVRGQGDFNTFAAEFDWSPDSRKIVFAYSPSRELDDYYLESSIATLDLVSGEIVPFEKRVPFEAFPRFSPDGQSIAYVSAHLLQKYAIGRQVAVCSVDGKKGKTLALTTNEGPSLSGPHFLGWSKEGKSLLCFEPKGTKYHLLSIPVYGGKIEEIQTGDLFFSNPSLSYDKSMIGCVVESPVAPPEVGVIGLKDLSQTQVSHLNAPLLSYPKLKTETISWRSTDGKSIEGLLTYPAGYQKGQSYPLLLVIHGGPMGVFNEGFIGTPGPYPLAAFAQEGFMIFRPNPRGSNGYGREFRCANYHDWGGGDYADIMSGIDALIALGVVDVNRMGVMGWSYGGYMTSWTITQTSRFKAASMGAGLSNLISMNGTTDLHRFLTDYLGKIMVHRHLYEERSPLNHVAQVKTPCLIQHGTEDKRVPVSQAYEFYHALSEVGKETTMVLFPGMGHALTDPKMALDCMHQNLNWFKHHL